MHAEPTRPLPTRSGRTLPRFDQPEAAPEIHTLLVSTDEASRGIVNASLKISIS